MKLDDEILNIWWHANHAWHSGDIKAATHMYKQLRSRHCIELFYEIQLSLPTRFVHPLGSVLGRAKYAPHLVVYQNVGVGSDLDGNQPVFTGPCVLFPGSKVLGKTTIGKNVFITANTVVQGVDVPDNVVVYSGVACDYSRDGIDGVYNHIRPRWKTTTRSVIERFFPADIKAKGTAA